MSLLPLLASLALAATPAPAATPGAADSDPSAQTRALVTAFAAVQRVPLEGDKTPVPAAEAAAIAKLDQLLDLETIGAAALEPHRAKLTPEQLTKIGTRFRELVRIIAYSGGGSFFRTSQYTIGATTKPAKGEGGDVLVTARDPQEDLEITMTFHWRPGKAGALRLVDVSFDGDSLIGDYQNQFGRIIGKEGAEGLLRRVEERYQEEVRKRREAK